MSNNDIETIKARLKQLRDRRNELTLAERELTQEMENITAAQVKLDRRIRGLQLVFLESVDNPDEYYPSMDELLNQPLVRPNVKS